MPLVAIISSQLPSPVSPASPASSPASPPASSPASSPASPPTFSSIIPGLVYLGKVKAGIAGWPSDPVHRDCETVRLGRGEWFRRPGSCRSTKPTSCSANAPSRDFPWGQNTSDLSNLELADVGRQGPLCAGIIHSTFAQFSSKRCSPVAEACGQQHAVVEDDRHCTYSMFCVMESGTCPSLVRHCAIGAHRDRPHHGRWNRRPPWQCLNRPGESLSFDAETGDLRRSSPFLGVRSSIRHTEEILQTR